MEVAFNRERELGEVAVAGDAGRYRAAGQD
jgi:hypothetical protein